MTRFRVLECDTNGDPMGWHRRWTSAAKTYITEKVCRGDCPIKALHGTVILARKLN